MHIPRQPDSARGSRPADGVDGLRSRRQDLVGRQRAVAYWQRLVQARTDLVVAGLLYSATPVPAAPTLPVTPGTPGTPGTPVRLGALGAPTNRSSAAVVAADAPAGTAAPQDLDDFRCLAEPPEGLDVSRLLSCADDVDGPGARLERLRDAAGLLARRRHAIDDELDAVTLALHDRLASDGEDRSAATTGTVAAAPAALTAPRPG